MRWRRRILGAGMACLLLWGGGGAAWAQKKVEDHPVIKPLPEVTRKEGVFHKFNAHKFRIKTEEGHQEKEIRGKYWEYSYHTTDDVSGLYILENYKAAALEKGGTILCDEKERLVFTLPTPEGGTLWVEVYRNGWNTYYRLHIIEEQPLKKVLTFGAAQIRSELETKGEVTLHGVHFDFNQATLRPESGKVLMEAARVLQALPEMRVEIQGHTCDIGGRAYNLKLSQARAETVKNFLVQQGIAPDRLVPRGYGMDQPVASNDTEEGRAQNRRVVFKRL